jgi:hypothetical protein
MKIENIGDEDSNFWVAEDESGKVIASGRDYSKVLREATNKAQEATKHIAGIFVDK